MTPQTLTLSTPIQAHGADVTELAFRELTGGDLEACGFPFRMIAGGETKFDTVAIGALIARLANVPPSAVKKLAPSDWLAAMGIVTSFFGAPGPAS